MNDSKKILLINPPTHNMISGSTPSVVDEERGITPPLGLLYIAAYLEKHTDHEIKIIDADLEDLTHNELFQKIKAFSPDITGLTATTHTLVDVLIAAESVKKADGNTKVVIGGPHVFLYPKETVAFPFVDFAVIGEGEVTFRELVDGIAGNRDLSAIKGLAYKNGPGVVITEKRELIEDLDEIPFPARHLTPYEKYTTILAKRKTITTMFTSRGCPYQCAFCNRPHLGKRFRYRSAKNVVDEMQRCHDMGIHEILIYDDTFTVNKNRVIDICDEILKRRLEIGWDIRTRVDNVDENIIKKVKSAGCERIHFGVESGVEKVLKTLNKGITIEQVKNAFEWSKKHRLETLAYFMIGNPGETRADILKTFAFMNSLSPDYVHLTILRPYPGTQIYFDGLASGAIKTDYWQAFAENPKKDFDLPHWDVNFSKDEINDLLKKGYKRFYIRPIYVLNHLKKVKSIGEVAKKAVAAFKVLTMK